MNDTHPDTDLLDWMQEYGVQVWRTANDQWVASLRHPKKFIQPTKPTLREAVRAAKADWLRFES